MPKPRDDWILTPSAFTPCLRQKRGKVRPHIDRDGVVRRGRNALRGCKAGVTGFAKDLVEKAWRDTDRISERALAGAGLLEICFKVGHGDTFAHSEQLRKSHVRYLRRANLFDVRYKAAMKVRIKEFRLARKLTVEQMGAAVGLSKSYVSELESGKKRINQGILESYAKFFGVQATDLIADEELRADLQSHLDVVKQLSEEDKLSVQRHALGLLRAQGKQ